MTPAADRSLKTKASRLTGVVPESAPGRPCDGRGAEYVDPG